MLSQINSKAIALVIDDKSYSFGALNSLVEKETKTLSGTQILEARATVEFIVKILASLKANIPAVVLPKDFKETQYLESILAKENLHPDCALVLLTSGSSGKLKLVQLSLKSIQRNISSISKSLNFSDIESQILFLPLSYSFGLIGQLFTALSLGKTTYLVNHFIKVKNLVEEQHINMVSGVPSHFPSLIKLLKDNTCITHVVSAGAFLGLDLRRDLIEAFPKATIYNNYGQTEIGPRALSFNSQDKNFLTKATGYPVEGIDFKIENGEIFFKGDQLMIGYIDGDSPIDKDGWLQTGDQATQEEGLITIQGRTDDIIKVDGNRISLLHLQEAIQSTLKENELVLLVSPKDELFCFSIIEISRQQHIQILKTIPVNIPFKNFKKLESIPRLPSGKVDRASLLNCL